MKGFSALVLAGSRPGGDPLARKLGVAHKALIDIGGEPMMVRVIAALREAGAGRIAVSCDDPLVAALAQAHGAEVMQVGAGPSGSALLAFAELGAPMLITTSDHGLLEGKWARDMVEEAPEDADIAIMFARRDLVLAVAPTTKRTWLRFADGDWSGCNLFLIAKPAGQSALDLWSRIEADRKHPWRIVAKLGLGAIISFAFGRMTLASGLAQLGRRHGMIVAVVRASSGFAAIDVDGIEDLRDVRSIIGGRSNT